MKKINLYFDIDLESWAIGFGYFYSNPKSELIYKYKHNIQLAVLCFDFRIEFGIKPKKNNGN
jgi:hypothetical protein